MSAPTPDARTRTPDRVSGAVLLAVALAVGVQATTFDVGFVTDPLGPKAFPMAVALLFAGAGLRLLLAPWPASFAWPEGGVLLRVAGAAAVFFAYAALLAPLGFLAATTLAVWSLSRFFGGPWKASLAAGLALAVVLWILFVNVLALHLPPGGLWTR